MAAFPGSSPLADGGKYHVFTTFKPLVNGAVATEEATKEATKEESSKENSVDTKEEGKKVEAEKEDKKEDKKEATLPETGENTGLAIYGAAALAILASVGLVAKRKDENA